MEKRIFCRDIVNDAAAVVDGVADEAVRGRFFRHCMGCADCQRAYQELLAVRRAVQNMPREQASEGFRARLRERLVAEVDRRSGLKWGLWRLAPAIGLCLVVGVCWLCFRGGTSDSQAPRLGPAVSPPVESVARLPDDSDDDDIYVHYVSQASYDPFVNRAAIDIDLGIAIADLRNGVD